MPCLKTDVPKNENLIELPDTESISHSGKIYDLLEAGSPYYLEQQKDIAFWTNIAKKYGDTILELACGTGRIAIPLAEQGFRVTGIDISESMLEVAAKKSSQLEWLQADVGNFDIGKKFSLIIFPYNSMLFCSERENIDSCLSCVRKHLKTGGKFVIDVLNPSPEYLINLFMCKNKELLSTFEDPDGKGTIVVTRTREYDPAKQMVTQKRFFKLPGEAQEIVEEIKYHLYFPQEIETLLKYNGFQVESKFGDYQGTTFTSSSPKQLIVSGMRE